MLYLIGLGLGDPTDVGVEAETVIKKCVRVYLEAYTSILLNGAEGALEEYYGRKIFSADREQVEMGSSDILAGAGSIDVAMLVVGDPLGATTHADLMLRAKESGVPVRVISNASVLTAVSATGLPRERFGEVVSIPYWADTWKPQSFCDKINANLSKGLHTLCLLDIKVKEQTVENIIKQRKIFEPPRFMRTHEAAQQLLSVVESRMEGSEKMTDSEVPSDVSLLTPDTTCVACVRLGSEEQQNVVFTLKEMSERDLGAPLHSLVVCAELTSEEQNNSAALASRYTGEQSLPAAGHLQLVGLGLSLSHVTSKGLRMLRHSSRVFLDEQSRQILKRDGDDPISKYEDVFSKDDLNLLKTSLNLEKRGVNADDCEEVLSELRNGKPVTIAVWGDPLVLTSYSSLLSKIKAEDITFSLIHNASIINSLASCGLQLYTYGEITHFPSPSSNYNDTECSVIVNDNSSFYNKLCENSSRGLHSLCVLHSIGTETLQQWQPQQAARLLVKLSGLSSKCDVTEKSSVVLVSLSSTGESQHYSASLESLAQTPTHDAYNDALCAIILVGHTHPHEEECLSAFSAPLTASAVQL